MLSQPVGEPQLTNTPQGNRYASILEEIFRREYHHGDSRVEFRRQDLETVARDLEIELPKNLGDIIYSFRFRNELPDSIKSTASEGLTWIIRLVGRARYSFNLVSAVRIVPSSGMMVTKIPDATPEIIATNTLGDEQAVLARVRYNRLIDIFLGITTYSLQNHLRTTVVEMGNTQVEIDEVYVAVDRYGAQYVIPVQAKGGSDQLSQVQTEQDIICCREKFPDLIPRPVAAQFMPDSVIALFELTMQDDEVRLVQERHYKLVPSDDVRKEDLELYRNLAD